MGSDAAGCPLPMRNPDCPLPPSLSLCEPQTSWVPTPSWVPSPVSHNGQGVAHILLPHDLLPPDLLPHNLLPHVLLSSCTPTVLGALLVSDAGAP